ncbi:MAG: hypothetical protein A4E53_02243 [Pelotomaculum sp. PtaB.Bin104]|nr:MAG: hypothetical protein A4E53_02243 [Pelotomaculum sp. PtaB.Bin104]
MSKVCYMELEPTVFSRYIKKTDTILINSLHRDKCFFAPLPEELESGTDFNEPVIHLINMKYAPGSRGVL